MTTLLVSSFTPALGTGRGTRTYGVARALLEHGPVEIVHVNFGAAQPDPGFARFPMHGVRSSRPAKALAYARGRASGMPDPVARALSPALAAAVARHPAARVVVEDIFAAASLLRVAAERPLVFSAQNLESAFRTDWGSKAEAFERRILEAYSESWMPSRADLEGARRLAPDATLRYVPNVVDVAAIAPVAPAGRSVLLLADYSYAPNREGFAWLTEEVLPWLPEDVEILVAGRGLETPSLPRVNVLGFVDDLAATYARAGCAVVPLLSGGGSPLKFVEALAYGVPVVATPKAAAGLDVVAGEHYLEAETPQAFAAAIDRALGDAALGAAGRALAEERYSVEALARAVAP